MLTHTPHVRKLVPDNFIKKSKIEQLDQQSKIISGSTV